MFHTLRWCVVCLITMLFPALAAADNDSSFGDDSNWARFGPGSWKLVRVYNENLNRQGGIEATSTKEIKWTLDSVEESRYTLKVEVTVEAAGKRFVAEPKFVRRGFHGETNGQEATVRKLGEAEIEISEQRIPTQIQEVTLDGTDLRRVKRIHYSSTVPPYVLKQEVVATDAEGKIRAFETSSAVVALEMPYKVLSQIKSTAFLHTVQRGGGQKIVALEVICADVPGGVVSHSAKEMDQAGNVMRRVTWELLDYEALMPPPGPEQLMGRRRPFLRGRRAR